MTTMRTIALTLLATVLVVLGYVYIGIFDVAADLPHGAALRWLAETARERSIAVRAIGIKVPPLDSPTQIAAGAAEYAQMCAGCHLGPGVSDNDFRKGLYPVAPALAGPEFARDLSDTEAARRFWIVKHGLKMSAMPAWGLTHDDDTLWSIVAFLQKLPALTPEQYAQMTKDSAVAHEGAEHEVDSVDRAPAE
jgi:mono/diheme cytochrome c family protein